MQEVNERLQKCIDEVHEKFFTSLKKEVENFSNIRDFNFKSDFYCEELMQMMSDSELDTFFYSSGYKSFGCIDTIVEACGHGKRYNHNWISFSAQSFNFSLSWFNYGDVELENLSDVVRHRPNVGVLHLANIFGSDVNIIPIKKILRDEDESLRFEFWECMVDAERMLVQFLTDGKCKENF